MTKTSIHFDAFCPASSVRPFINDILKNSGLTIAQIAEECDFPAKELYRVMTNHVNHIPRGLFNRILYFYCYICCKDQFALHAA